MWQYKAVFLFFFMALPDGGQALDLSQKKVIRLVLEHSPRHKKIKSEEKTVLQGLSSAEAFLDWRLFSQTAFKTQEQNTLNFFENPFQETWNSSSGLEKTFPTGTYLKLEYTHLFLEREFNPEFKKISASPSSTVRQNLTLTIEQDLLRNIFGYEDRLKLKTAVAKVEQKRIKLIEEKEDLILKATRQFWLAYISYLSFKLKLEKKKDYTDLVRITKRKKDYGYLKPGELSQIQAEWEQAKQELTLERWKYKDQTAKLFNLLNIPKPKNINFIINKNPPAPPKLESSLPQTHRTVLLMKKNLLIKEQQLKLQKSRAYPTLKFFGSYGIGGYDKDFSSSFEGLKNRNNRNHSFGVKFSYPLPSTKIRGNRISLSKQAVETSRLQLEITKKDFEILTNSTQKQLYALYTALKIAGKIHRLRTTAYKEIRKAFLQGRLSVFELISAKEFALLSEMEKGSLTAQYYQALIGAKALKDQLF